MATTTEFDDHSINRTTNYQNKVNTPKSVCFKVFIITTLVLALIAMITSSLAILCYNGRISGLNSLTDLLKIGEVNCYMMLAAGTILFAVGIVAWFCHLKKEQGSS